MSIRSINFDVSEEHMKALHRFNETCQDGQEYDVGRSVMKSMTYVGLVRWCGGSRFEITDFGIAVLDMDESQSVEYGTTPGCKQCEEAENCGLTDCPECDAKLCEDVNGTGVKP